MTDWCNRPLDRVYPVIFIDAIVVKVRDGQVRNKPIYVVIGVTVTGERDILGLWAGDGGEGAKFWLQVLTELKNRGVADVCIAVCDGLKGLPDAITTAWPLTTVQQCIIHLLRNTFRYARGSTGTSRQRPQPVYTAAVRIRGPGPIGGLRREAGHPVSGDQPHQLHVTALHGDPDAPRDRGLGLCRRAAGSCDPGQCRLRVGQDP